VIRAVEGPLAAVRGEPPEALAYHGAAESLQAVWIALRANLRGVLEQVSLAEVAAGDLPEALVQLTQAPEAWSRR
jgi:DNA-binding IscR family transcriptional regulator